MTTRADFMSNIHPFIAILPPVNWKKKSRSTKLLIRLNCLYEDTPPENTSCKVSGLEGTKEVIIKNNKICSAGEGLICAGVKEGDESTIQYSGNVGAPLVFNDKLIGIGLTANSTNYIAETFQGVKNYEDWIYGVTDSAVTVHVSPLVLLCTLAAIIKMRS
ncbi:hypothetical protein L9F63_020595 [Diploptera punctata]|uniref:Uncharacterized protein n=1 Tax=Diploptera punctata TaxID=6984 RepID=A0AAD7ZR66_DIPPU|nr:hypothetical protein L9F63_020595 [Diploptera punctata]